MHTPQGEHSANGTNPSSAGLPLVSGIHALVDLVNHSERRIRHVLQAQQVQHGSHGPLL